MDTPVSVAEALENYVLPALNVLTEEGEVTSVHIWQNPRQEIEAAIYISGEKFIANVWQPGVTGDDVNWLGTFASSLQDFIAESAFAWGTLRHYPAEWGM